MKAEIKIPDGYEGPLPSYSTKRDGDLILGSGASPEWRATKHPGDLVGNAFVIRRIPALPKVRPLNAEEWDAVAHCVASRDYQGTYSVPRCYFSAAANFYFDARATCHPPGFPNDVRKLWVEE